MSASKDNETSHRRAEQREREREKEKETWEA